MNTLRLLKQYDISHDCAARAIHDVSWMGVRLQRKLIKELFTGLKFDYPNKKYLIELTLKYLVHDIVQEQITKPYTTLKPYTRAVNKAKKMGKESIYARHVLAGQKAKRKKRKGT
jgi:hypothetical protein